MSQQVQLSPKQMQQKWSFDNIQLNQTRRPFISTNHENTCFQPWYNLNTWVQNGLTFWQCVVKEVS